jgi:hypothetical protein
MNTDPTSIDISVRGTRIMPSIQHNNEALQISTFNHNFKRLRLRKAGGKLKGKSPHFFGSLPVPLKVLFHFSFSF